MTTTEAKELRRLHRKVMSGRATRREVLRALELKQKKDAEKKR